MKNINHMELIFRNEARSFSHLFDSFSLEKLYFEKIIKQNRPCD